MQNGSTYREMHLYVIKYDPVENLILTIRHRVEFKERNLKEGKTKLS